MSNWFDKWTPGEHETYRKRVQDVPAFRYGHENEPEWFRTAVDKGWIKDENGRLHLIQGENTQYAWRGDWILLAKGHCTGVHHDQFVDLYEPTAKYAKLMA